MCIWWRQISSIFVCLRKYLSIFPLFKGNFTGCRVLGWRVFILNTLNISCHSLACMVSEEKSDVIIFPLPQGRCVFPLVSFRIFTVYLTYCILKVMPRCVFGVIYPASCSLSFLDLCFDV